MDSYYTSLEELGPAALEERDKVEQVKARIGVSNGHLDAWIYSFLENKNFDVEETVTKLERRFAMEVNELATYELTEYKRQSMRSGVVQEIGRDRKGRTILYVKVKRDFPQAKYRAERQELFDIYLSYATRLCPDHKRCQMILLVDQEGASMFKNIDIPSSADLMLRVSKYFPGAVEKIYICNMGGALARIARPIISRMPEVVSQRFEVFSSREQQLRGLREVVDDEVLPESLGGRRQLREPAVWERFAAHVEAYFTALQHELTGKQTAEASKAEIHEAKSEEEGIGRCVKAWELRRCGICPRTGVVLASPSLSSPATSQMWGEKNPENNEIERSVKNGESGDNGESGEEEEEERSSLASLSESGDSLEGCLGGGVGGIGDLNVSDQN